MCGCWNQAREWWQNKDDHGKRIIGIVAGVVLVAVGVGSLYHCCEEKKLETKGILNVCEQKLKCPIVPNVMIEKKRVVYSGGNKLVAALLSDKPSALPEPVTLHSNYDGVSIDGSSNFTQSLFLTEGTQLRWTILAHKQNYHFQLLYAEGQITQECFKSKSCYYIHDRKCRGTETGILDVSEGGKYRMILSSSDSKTVLFSKLNIASDYKRYDIQSKIIESHVGQYAFTLGETTNGKCVIVDFPCSNTPNGLQNSEEQEANFNVNYSIRKKPLFISLLVAGILCVLGGIILFCSCGGPCLVIDFGTSIIYEKFIGKTKSAFENCH